jgi:glycosyltransferase involved in cell wall biosynthesis
MNLRHLKHKSFEVVVVNGPSTDETETICQEFGDSLKYCLCPDVNLSMSRNIGIAAAAGEICAFIDDDALTHPDWLSNIVSEYTSEKIWGVGGYTIDHTGLSYQATAVLCDRFGKDYPVYSGIDTESFCFPSSPLYPSLLGTNSSFRRSKLFEIGGFDETFEYFLDETDVCLRMVDAGGVIKYNPKAIIYHRYAASHLRDQENVPKSRYQSLKSQSYFMHRHASGIYTNDKISIKISELSDTTKKANHWLCENNRINTQTLKIFNSEVNSALKEGFDLAYKKQQFSDLNTKNTEQSGKFTLFNKFKKPLRIAFICRNYPPADTAGIARWTHTLCNGMAHEGCQVYVICQAVDHPCVDFVNGVWEYRIQCESQGHLSELCSMIDLPSQNLDWSASAYVALEQIGFDNLDLISAPIWEVEGLVAQLASPIPVVTSLHTTYQLARPYKPDWINRPFYNYGHVQKICDAEKTMLELSKCLLANSKSIITDIENEYKVSIKDKSLLVPHGVDDVKISEVVNDSKLTKFVLFVGRKETRKGYDTALKSAMICTRSNSSIKFKFIGSDCDDVNSFGAQSSIPSSLDNRISIEGHIPEDELNNAYRECTIFMAPSRYESFGLVAVEAMRYSKPVIVGKSGGLAEVIENGVDGYHVDPDDSEELAKIILDLWERDDLRNKLGIAARKSYENKYTTDIMVTNAISAYSNIVKNN